MDNLGEMAVFARVVETESFSAAARVLGISKSAASKQVSRLEDRLGVRLLNRTTRRLSLTEAGAAFYAACERVVAEAEAAEAAVRRLAAAPRGTLKVNVPMSFGMLYLAPALPDFMARYPELAVDMVLNDRLVDLVEEGFDMGVRIGRLTDSSLIARRLGPNRMLLYAAPSYLSRHGRPETPRDLLRHECLVYSYQRNVGDWRFRGPDGEETRLRVKGRLTINNGDALHAAALGGLGITLQPSFICGGDLEAGRVERLLPDWQAARESSIYAVYPASRNLLPKVRVFVDFLAERFGETPVWEAGLGV
jgi:DNA-binding transcriptional LysR family regulator